jgi:hypothetical protein
MLANIVLMAIFVSKDWRAISKEVRRRDGMERAHSIEDDGIEMAMYVWDCRRWQMKVDRALLRHVTSRSVQQLDRSLSIWAKAGDERCSSKDNKLTAELAKQHDF